MFCGRDTTASLFLEEFKVPINTCQNSVIILYMKWSEKNKFYLRGSITFAENKWSASRISCSGLIV